MPHDTIFVAIFGLLFYVFVPQYFGYVAVAMALWLGFPVMKVVWQTTKDLRDIPDATIEKDDDKGEEAKGDENAEALADEGKDDEER